MSDTTRISWTDATLNPIYGCSRVSAGCTNCYAEQVVASLPRKFEAKNKAAFEFYSGLTRDTPNGPRWTGVVKLHREHLRQPLGWQIPKKIFVNSLSDVFHENVPRDFIVEIFSMMALAHWHTFQVLTKRPERMQQLLSEQTFIDDVIFAASLQNSNHKHERNKRLGKNHPGLSWPLKNVWLGVSVENQKAANERVPLLIKTPATIRFLSCEPLLEGVDLRGLLGLCYGCQTCGFVTGHLMGPERSPIHWAIIGGESGAGFRPMKSEWALNLKHQCIQAGIAFYFKQDADQKAGQRPYLVEKNGDAYYWRQFPGEMTDPQELI